MWCAVLKYIIQSNIMKILTDEIRNEIEELVYDFLSEECEIEKSDIQDNFSLIDDLDGDSLMFVELVELLKKKYTLNIQMQTIGKYLLKNPAGTVREVIDTACLVYEKENDITEAS